MEAEVVTQLRELIDDPEGGFTMEFLKRLLAHIEELQRD